MPDEVTQPEELIERIADAASEFSPVDAVTFRETALENLSTFREQSVLEESAVIRERLLAGEISPLARFSIPDRYSQTPELFLVFDAFIGVFLEPVELAVTNINLLGRFELSEGIGFARPGESVALRETLQLKQGGGFREARIELRGMASELGFELFGPNFELADFSNSDADTITG